MALSDIQGQWKWSDDASPLRLSWTFSEDAALSIETSYGDEVMFTTASYTIESTDSGIFALMVTEIGDDGLPMGPDQYAILVAPDRLEVTAVNEANAKVFARPE